MAEFTIRQTAAGVLEYCQRTGATPGTFVVIGTSPTIPNSCLVAAAIRSTRMGRADDRGMRIGLSQVNMDDTEDYPSFINDDFY